MLVKFALCQLQNGCSKELVHSLVKQAYELAPSLTGAYTKCADLWLLKGDLETSRWCCLEDKKYHRHYWKTELKLHFIEKCLKNQISMGSWLSLKDKHEDSFVCGENCELHENQLKGQQILIGTDRSYWQASNVQLQLNYWMTLKEDLLKYSMAEYESFLTPETIKIFPVQAIGNLKEDLLTNSFFIDIDYLHTEPKEPISSSHSIDINLLQLALHVTRNKVTIYTTESHLIKCFVDQLPILSRQKINVIHAKKKPPPISKTENQPFNKSH